MLKLFTLFECVFSNLLHRIRADFVAITRLPRLEHLGLFSRSQTGRDAGDFLERHGPKIQELDIQYFPTDSVLEMCTALRTLRIQERKPVRISLLVMFRIVLTCLQPPGYSAAGWKSNTLTTIKFTEAIPCVSFRSERVST